MSATTPTTTTTPATPTPTKTKLNEIFDEVYVINLDRATDRLQAMDRKLAKHGIKYKRLNAVDGRKLDPTIIDAECTPVCANFAIYGAIGCALSHKTIWNDVVQRGLKQVLVLEDDAVFCADFNRRFLASWESVPADWDLVHLGAVLSGGDRDQYTWFDWVATVPLLLGDVLAGSDKARGRYVDEARKIVVPDMNAGCHAYAVTRAGCQKLLSRIPIISYPGHIDILIAHEASRHMNRYAVVDSSLVTQPTMTEHSSIATTGSPHLGNYLLDKIALTRRDTRAGWVMSGSIARIGSSIQLSCWRLLWVLLGFLLGLQRLPMFAAAMLADDVAFGTKENRNINQLIFDISLFAFGAMLRTLSA